MPHKSQRVSPCEVCVMSSQHSSPRTMLFFTCTAQHVHSSQYTKHMHNNEQTQQQHNYHHRFKIKLSVSFFTLMQALKKIKNKK